MLLENKFDAVQAQLATHILRPEKVLPWVDLTRLDAHASINEIETLIQKAQQEHVAAICVFPRHLDWIPPLDPIRRATVVNFPGGDQVPDRVLKDIECAIEQHHADEIDYVFAYPTYLAGDTALALAWCRDAYQLCLQHGRLFKVILETGALSSMDIIYQLSCDVIEAGCHMLKTSTGKIPVGASLPAAFAMLTAIQDSNCSCGIKLSGGIKTVQQASAYVHLAEHMLNKPVDKSWFRIGASTIA